MNYTTIDHDARMKFGLSCNEYCVADRIYHLANNPENGSRWCYAKRETLGDMLGFTKQSIINLLKPLIGLGLVEMHPKTKYLRTTELWYRNFTLGKESLPNSTPPPGKESLPKRVKKVYPLGKESLPEPGKESLPPSNKEISLEEELEKDLEKTNERTREENFVLPAVDENRFALKNTSSANEEIPPVAPPPLTAHQQIDLYHSRMVGNQALIEAAQVKQKVRPEEFHEALGEFIIDKKAIDHVPKDEADFRKHFLAWLKDWKRRKLEALNPPVTHGKQAYGYSDKPELSERIQSGLEYFAQMRAVHPAD